MKYQKELNLSVGLCRHSLATNGSRLGEGGVFTTNVDTKHELQTYEKVSNEALNRHFCQTDVTCWRFCPSTI